jgi:ribonuclease P protein component
VPLRNARLAGPRPAPARPRAVFDTRSRPGLSSAGRRRAMCLEGRRRVCVPLGEDGHDRPRRPDGEDPDSPDDEADLPAQEAPSRQGARFPRPDEVTRRPPHPCDQAGSRSEAADGLTIGRGIATPRLVMLSRPQDFAAIQGSGTTRSHPLLSARFLRTDLGTTRFGLSTNRRLGGAVVRNRVRRRLREALRVMAPSFQPGWDVLIIARPTIVEADHDALVGALHRTLVRGGVIGGPG